MLRGQRMDGGKGGGGKPVWSLPALRKGREESEKEEGWMKETERRERGGKQRMEDYSLTRSLSLYLLDHSLLPPFLSFSLFLLHTSSLPMSPFLSHSWSPSVSIYLPLCLSISLSLSSLSLPPSFSSPSLSLPSSSSPSLFFFLSLLPKRTSNRTNDLYCLSLSRGAGFNSWGNESWCNQYCTFACLLTLPVHKSSFCCLLSRRCSFVLWCVIR